MPLSLDPVLLQELARSGGVAAAIAALTGLLLVLTRRMHLPVTGDPLAGAVHKIHRVVTCRAGGVALLAGFVVGLVDWVWLSNARFAPDPRFAGLLLAALVPVAACGIAEDLTKRVGPLQRLFWIGLGALLLAGTKTVWIGQVGVDVFDAMLAAAPFALAFTVVAVTGATNAFNIVDGLNGLLGGVALITLAAIAWVAHRVGDAPVFGIALLAAAATLAWLPFNWPGARLFAGDGGAYVLGFVIAVLLVVLVQRNPQVSPWFGLTAAALPVWETLYSIWRRRHADRATMQADQCHLHQLVRIRVHWSIKHRALRRAGVWADDWTPSDEPAKPLPVDAPNGACSPILWLMHGAAVVAGVLYFDDTGSSILVFLGFAAIYVPIHRRLSRSRLKYRLALAA